MSNPALFRSIKSIKYADVRSEDELQKNIRDIDIDSLYNSSYAKVDITIPKTDHALINIPDNSVDFVFSSHSLEHAPNPIDSIIDYYRVIKDDGIVYTIVPNKHNTYDRMRADTPLNKLIKKWKEKNYSYTLDEFYELYDNTTEHPFYHNKNKKEIKESWKENSGMHRVYVYSEKNILELIKFLTDELKGSELMYFQSDWDIHLAIKKNPVRNPRKTKAEKQFHKMIKSESNDTQDLIKFT